MIPAAERKKGIAANPSIRLGRVQSFNGGVLSELQAVSEEHPGQKIDKALGNCSNPVPESQSIQKCKPN